MADRAKTSLAGAGHGGPERGEPSDMPAGGWIDRLAPASVAPYMRLARLDRPIGSWLLLFPCWWGVALASAGFPDLRFMALFAIGAVIMRAAGCTVNDIADRDFDARVARTRARPIACGDIGLPQAFAFLGLLLLAGLGVLVTFNPFTVALGIAALPLIVAYPFMKRITYWPQAFLGLTFNWGALLGWAAVEGVLAAPALALYAGAFFWTLGYDTIYAHQDKADDLIVGVKSTALKLGEGTRPWLFAFYGLAVALFALAGALAGIGLPFFVLLAAAAGHFAWQAATVRIDAPADCLAKFKSNKWVGWTLLAAIVAGRLVG
jgi:4-hydroxybenzoate polyprenyltransferase